MHGQLSAAERIASCHPMWMVLTKPPAVLPQKKEISILKRVSFNRNVVQFYGFCLEEQAPMLVRSVERAYTTSGILAAA
jgi:polyphosphate kinase 2 (PPK2 family)